jgi:hypothetical protein
MKIECFSQIDGDENDPLFEVLFHGEPDVKGHNEHVSIELDHLQALQLANALIGWVTTSRERAECWVEAEKAAELAIPV